MAQLFHMPQLGSTMEEGTILKWHKQEGDSIKAGDLLLEIETDKASMEVDATVDGVVRKILAPADTTVPIRQPIAIIGAAEESIDALLAQVGLGVEGALATSPAASAPNAPPTQSVNGAAAPAAAQTTPVVSGPVFFSPRARRVADSHGIPIVALAGRGSGPEGRVLEKDVLTYLQAQQTSPAVLAAPGDVSAAKTAPRVTPLAARIADDLGVNLNDLATGLPGSRVRSQDVLRHAEAAPPAARPSAPPASPSPQGSAATEAAPSGSMTRVPFSGMRKRIADNVVRSAFTAPHVTLTLEVDMTAASELRARLIPDVEKVYKARLSYTDILVKTVARALDEHPMLNATLVGDEIHLHAAKNIGVAVALEEGLIVPVVKSAEKRSLGALSAELKQLIERARTGTFTPDDLSGGTFSITNLGTFGIDVFDPIIVTGQAAILGVGRIADRPIVVDKEILVRTMMNLCLSFDHRIVDGAPAARFLQRCKELLETPLTVLI